MIKDEREEEREKDRESGLPSLPAIRNYNKAVTKQKIVEGY